MLRFFLLLVPFLPFAAMACPVGPLPEPTRSAVDVARPDQGLMTTAVLHQINSVRCSAGLPMLLPSFALAEVAARHSEWMAISQSLSHVSQVPGQEELRDRLDASREDYSMGAENVGYVSACGRNYAELANAMVRWWLDSAPHRQNMLNPDLEIAGAGIALKDGCARAYMTLDLSGR